MHSSSVMRSPDAVCELRIPSEDGTSVGFLRALCDSWLLSSLSSSFDVDVSFPFVGLVWI